MPIALKLSKQFYETFGEQATNELVDAINQVDATYRSDLKDIFEPRFAQFEAKQELRFAQFEKEFAELKAAIERRFNDQSRFMLLGWGTTIAAVIGSAIAFR